MLNIVIFQDKLSRRLNRATGSFLEVKEQNDIQSVYVRIVAALGFVVARSGFLSAKTLKQLRHTLQIAGIRGANSLGIFVGAKFLFLIFFPFFSFLVCFYTIKSEILIIFVLIISSIIGLLIPDFFVNQRRKIFITRLESGLADTLDMMVICADAGLSLEATLARVAYEIRHTHNAVSTELTITGQELRIGTNVKEALAGLGARTGLSSLKRLGSTLVQTIQYGTPLTQALRVLSAELRQEQLTKFEERAARLPVLLTIPMIIFILPCVFLVVGGPAILKVMHAFTHN